jgi:hypothetical protein
MTEGEWNRHNNISAIIEAISNRGILPTDEIGNLLPLDEILIHIGANELISAYELRLQKEEPIALFEMQAVVDQLEANMP